MYNSVSELHVYKMIVVLPYGIMQIVHGGKFLCYCGSFPVNFDKTLQP